jgi:hypothetical protein
VDLVAYLFAESVAVQIKTATGSSKYLCVIVGSQDEDEMRTFDLYISE